MWVGWEEMQIVPIAIWKDTFIGWYDNKLGQGRVVGHNSAKNRLTPSLLQPQMRQPTTWKVATQKHKRRTINQNNPTSTPVQITLKHSILSDEFFEEEKWVRVEGGVVGPGYKFSEEQATTVLIMIVAYHRVSYYVL